MKFSVEKFIIALMGTMLITSCSNDSFSPPSIFTDQSAASYPVKNIFATEGDISSPYITLGNVEYTLQSNFAFFSDQSSLHNQAIEKLKQEAVARYGDRVDAIINLEFQDSGEQSGYFSPTLTYVRGLAIAYKETGGARPYSKTKRKHKGKSTKSSPAKTKSPRNTPAPSRSTPAKSSPDMEEPEITPSELLK